MVLHDAVNLAIEICNLLEPFCERVEVAGSIRRGKENPGDIEIVCIPKTEQVKDMFNNVIDSVPVPGFISTINTFEKIKGDPTGKYTQRVYKGETVDIFMVTRRTWAAQLMIRTGDAEFSHLMMKIANKRGFEQRDGILYYDGRAVDLVEEKDYFAVLDVPYVEPRDRTADAFKLRHVLSR